MNKETSAIGLWVPRIYAVLFISLLIFFFVLDPMKSEFAGLYLIPLTLPWSITLVVVTIALDTSGHPGVLPFPLTLTLLIIFAAINFRSLSKLATGITETREQRRHCNSQEGRTPNWRQRQIDSNEGKRQ